MWETWLSICSLCSSDRLPLRIESTSTSSALRKGPSAHASTGNLTSSSKLAKRRVGRSMMARKLSSSTTVGSFAVITTWRTRSASALRRAYSASIAAR